MNNDQLYKQFFGRDHMSGVERDKERITKFAEHFTPEDLAFESLDKSPKMAQPGEIVLDPFAGDFTLLCSVVWRKIENGMTYTDALQEVRSGEYHIDNCLVGIGRLYGPGKIETLQGKDIPEHMKSDGLKACFKHEGRLLENHVACDSFIYDFSFGKKQVFGQGLFTIG